jgi:hypothetical protein
MSHTQDKVVVRVDGYTRVCLTVIAALLTVLIAGLWAQGVPAARDAAAASAPPPAPAGIPDAGGQRDRMVRELERVTAKLDQLIGLFESGKAKVQVSSDGKEAGKDNAPKENN